MKTPLLFTVGLVATLAALPATAAPILTSPAQAILQASINPIFMQYEGVDGSCAALNEASNLIIDALAAPPERGGPSAEESARIRKVGQGDIILAELIQQAADDNSSRDAAGNKICDLEGFSKSFLRMLNNKNPELTRFAAVGWDMTEKRATARLATLLKDPSVKNANEALQGILIGLLKEVESCKYYVGTANGGIWKATQSAVEAGDLADWQANYGTGV